MTDGFEATLHDAVAHWDLTLKPEQVERLCHHYQAMVAANRRFNLTRITEPDEAAVKHYADSLAVVEWAGAGAHEVSTVLDIGSGAGFPAFPLAVARPEWSVTAIDATRKKVDFVESVASDVSLVNLRCVHAHSAHWNQTDRFSLVLFRALSAAPAAMAQAARFVGCGGHAVAFVTPATHDAMRKETVAAAGSYGLRECDAFRYTLPWEGDRLQRVLWIFQRR